MQYLDVDLAPLSGFDVLYLLAPIDRHIGGRFSLAGFVVLAGKDDLQGVVRINCTEETGFERFARSFGAAVNQGIVLDRRVTVSLSVSSSGLNRLSKSAESPTVVLILPNLQTRLLTVVVSF